MDNVRPPAAETLLLRKQRPTLGMNAIALLLQWGDSLLNPGIAILRYRPLINDSLPGQKLHMLAYFLFG
ncbi:hypothetical protein D3C77_471220 [compost metagenome]